MMLVGSNFERAPSELYLPMYYVVSGFNGGGGGGWEVR